MKAFSVYLCLYSSCLPPLKYKHSPHSFVLNHGAFFNTGYTKKNIRISNTCSTRTKRDIKILMLRCTRKLGFTLSCARTQPLVNGPKHWSHFLREQYNVYHMAESTGYAVLRRVWVIILVQQECRRECGVRPSGDKSIRKCFKQFRWRKKRHSTGLSRTSDENVEPVRQAFMRSTKKSIFR